MLQDGRESFDESFVYEEFSGIRSAFEQLIDRCGYEAVEGTMRKVVHVLEKFETLITYKRQADLRLANADLRLEEEKEASSQEHQMLNRKISVLKEENESVSHRNTQLQQQHKDIQTSQKHQEQPDPTTTTEVLEKLNDVIATQEQTVNELRDEYEELSIHNGQQSALILKLKSGLQESVHSHRALKSRNDRLCNELAAREAQLAALELARGSTTDTRAHSEDRGSWESVEDIKTKSEVIRDVLTGYSAPRRRPNKCQCELSGYRFTVDEMTLLINQRNIAKEKLIAAEEELYFLRERHAIDPIEFVTEEGFAILEPPRATSQSLAPSFVSSHALTTRESSRGTL